MKRLTREWVKKAENDHIAATMLSRGKVTLHDSVCFHCQQCANKSLHLGEPGVRLSRVGCRLAHFEFRSVLPLGRKRLQGDDLAVFPYSFWHG